MKVDVPELLAVWTTILQQIGLKVIGDWYLV
jgi:hypothetical protein